MIGQLVECLDAEATHDAVLGAETPLVAGEVYRVRWAGPFPERLHGEEIGVRLEGLVRGPDDHPYGLRRFRPLGRLPQDAGA